MTEESIKVERGAGFHVLILNRPGKLNSFNAEMNRALFAAFEAAAADDDCRAVLLTGAGRAFCAGQDLGDRNPAEMDGPPDLGETLETLYNPLIRAIRAIEKPVVCAVNGVAAGAGANIALACDIVLASKSAKFIQAFCKVGLVPDSGGTWSLPRLIGEARAKALAMTGIPVGAEQAENWGMIWKAVDDDALMDEAHGLVKGFATAPTVGLGFTKRAIQAAAVNSLDQQLDLERDLQREAGRTPDYAEGVSAFLNKRSPNFSGRKA
ncbi:2-(1,2-epoxy-1,2-dihydrophenyl)acetyl-CoA isomerase PaaG [Pelagibius sp. Alg239-R121]|uniref:2-(1,2-epoxy-1,2-dihydrophenyl)acetyl-CoA isomerase PaaG n=1 Tax=Pelagibius sp. Alg239-R121 TaxID=2993448 RepID=UPI0024A6AB87|nr:2-(1,2-epoxy-1,2-dihydrophenyl)acetyl-CoA isomerase PaaG [Pelagibius sp. Alg239-R121]